VQSRDARFDGWFVVAVRTTGIYCRPSCPAITPRRSSCRFLPSSAAAQLAGFRACKRCRPDASPGSPEWNRRADLTARAMRLIADGLVDREGVRGLARRLGYSERQLNRQLVAELGAGPLALARAQRAQTARTLIETTALPFAHVAFAAGFSSIRQFNDTVREVFALSPSDLRRRAARAASLIEAGSITLRLPVRLPFAGGAAIGFLAARAVPGVESAGEGTFRRTLRLPHGAGAVALTPSDDHVTCRLWLADLRDLAAAVERSRRLLDLDADPVAVDGALGDDPLLAALVAAVPGRRSPGAVDGPELAVRAVLGQQITVAAARTVAGRLAARLGEPLALGVPDDLGLTRLFCDPAVLADAPDDALPMPAARRTALRALAGDLADGSVVVDPGADASRLTEQLRGRAGIGRWTAAYVAMRAVGDPDVWLEGDVVLRQRLRDRSGVDLDHRGAAALAARWKPWRSYAVHHLWAGAP
jgi:AraC family transcriptional regulator of adaptative response / DNA-3-methyladenine glycosylase II